MTDVRSEYIGMLVHAAERKYAKKEAGAELLLAADLASRGVGTVGGLTKAGFKAVSGYAVPLGAMYLFGKYIAIPMFASYALGGALARSTSPSKADLEAAENNALAKETERRTSLLQGMPSVTPQPRNKDMVTRRNAFDEDMF